LFSRELLQRQIAKDKKGRETKKETLRKESNIKAALLPHFIFQKISDEKK
jgi:hypothetical protein